MAEKWERLQETKDLFPNLVFRTVGDERVREDHAELDGIIKPIDDAFWSKYFPPLDWRCRCDAVPTAEKPKGEVPKNMPEPNFIGNVGKDAEIFTQKHNFFRLINNNKTAVNNREVVKLFIKPEVNRTPKGNKIKINVFADQKDLSSNWEIGVKMADKLKLNVEIRAHLNNGWSNPEYKINGLIADLYQGSIINGFALKPKQVKTFIKQYNNRFTNNKISENYAIAFDISGTNINYDIARVVNGKLKAGRNLSFVVIAKDENIIMISKSDTFQEIVEKVNSLNAKEK